ncbi:MAG: caspase family protein [Candidatus Paceibacterota bacterium]
MSKELIEFKKARVVALSKQYNIDLSSLNSRHANNIRILNRQRMAWNRRKLLLDNLKKQYNAILVSLQNKLKINIEAVNSLTILPINVTRKKALLFGLDYLGTGSQLNGCINDANLIGTRIQASGFTDIKFITDNTIVKPTRANILSEFKALLSGGIEGDLLFIYYSGHGSYTIDRNGDELDGKDELIIPLDFNAISDDELKSIIQENLKPNVTLFCLFDCCNSGTVLDLKYQYLESLNYDNFTENDRNLETKGNVILLSGCRDDQYSYESLVNDKVHGAMSWAFNELTKTDTNITWRTLLKNMRTRIKSSNFNQIPQLSSGLVIDLDSKIWI